MGTAGRMGPLLLSARARHHPGHPGTPDHPPFLWLPSAARAEIGAFAWRPLIFIVGANLLFGLLLGGWPSIGIAMGLIVTIVGLTFVAMLAGANSPSRAPLCCRPSGSRQLLHLRQDARTDLPGLALVPVGA